MGGVRALGGAHESPRLTPQPLSPNQPPRLPRTAPHLQREAGGLNLLLARHEDQNVAGRVPQVHRHRLLHRRLHVVLLRSERLANTHQMSWLDGI